MTESTATERPRGRPRSAASREAILAAAFALLRQRGYAGLAIEAVAERAGVGKATIYRWWPDRAALAVEAFFEATRDALAFPDTGSAREDFRRQIHGVADLLRGENGAAMAAMVAGARTDPALGRALAERWVTPRKRWGIERMQRAIAAGECVEGLDVEAALAALYSPVYAPMLLGAGVPPAPALEAILSIVFAGVFRPAV